MEIVLACDLVVAARECPVRPARGGDRRDPHVRRPVPGAAVAAAQPRPRTDPDRRADRRPSGPTPQGSSTCSSSRATTLQAAMDAGAAHLLATRRCRCRPVSPPSTINWPTETDRGWAATDRAKEAIFGTRGFRRGCGVVPREASARMDGPLTWVRCDTRSLLLDVDDGVATITFNRPDHRNADDRRDGDRRCTTPCVSSPRDDVRVRRAHRRRRPVLQPRRRSRRQRQARGTASASPDRCPTRGTCTSAVVLHEMPQVTLAAINGSCAGAGLRMGAGCDLRVASSDAPCSPPPSSTSVSPATWDVPWSLPRIVGGAKARELFFLRGKFYAAKALEHGSRVGGVRAGRLPRRCGRARRPTARASPRALAHHEGQLRCRRTVVVR